MIPKIIHRMWLDKTIDNNLYPPKKYKPLMDTFDKYNPEFKVEFWNMAKVKSLFEYPVIQQYQDTWENLPHHIQKCDMARYFIMYLFGGIYIDLDFTCFKNLSPLLDRELLLVLEPPEHYENGIRLYNGFIGSVPGHQFWLDWLDYISESVLETNDVMETTGPTNFGKFWQQSKYRSIHLVDTCDIIPLYSCYEKPHCLTKKCAERLDKSDRKSGDYYLKLDNYVDNHWINGSGWGNEQLKKNDIVEKMDNLSASTNNGIWIGLAIGLVLLILVFIIFYYLLFHKKIYVK